MPRISTAQLKPKPKKAAAKATAARGEGAPTPAPQGPSPEALEWELGLRLWWAINWRTMLVVYPTVFVVSSLLNWLYTGSLGEEQTLIAVQELTIVAVLLIISVALQVAVMRYIIRKKRFMGFTLAVESSKADADK
jgi:hypothetical protein